MTDNYNKNGIKAVTSLDRYGSDLEIPTEKIDLGLPGAKGQAPRRRFIAVTEAGLKHLQVSGLSKAAVTLTLLTIAQDRMTKRRDRSLRTNRNTCERAGLSRYQAMRAVALIEKQLADLVQVVRRTGKCNRLSLTAKGRRLFHP
jgi:hypothetical protein